MSQQLNLLREERFAANPALIALLVWSLTVLLILAIWSVNLIRLSAARTSAEASARELKEAQALIQQRADTRAALNSEIQAIQPMADAAQQLLNMAADLGLAQGYSSFFHEVANVVDDGLWLTDVKISKSGKVIEIGGMSLNSDTIMGFGRNLNTRFANRGVKMTALELKPQTASLPGPGGAVLSGTKFTLR